MEPSFGERVRDLREAAGMNQTQLGQALYMTQRKISYLECGKCQPSLEDLAALCMYFGVSADYLLGLPDDLYYPHC